MLYAIFFCSAALGGQCFPAEGGKDPNHEKVAITYPSQKACERKKDKRYAPHATANISYECRIRKGDKWISLDADR